ncbi:MAG: rhodanese-like domain-containing protein [Burkholderiaceae bacterium]|nr:rhodanese-like domain-containing protein [Burkholderiaceae bacterium]
MEHLEPKRAAELLKVTPDALFIDCRSDAEHFFVGHPVGAVHVAWLDGPDWEQNPHFEAEVRRLAGHAVERPVVLICRSGRRSVDAGLALEQAGFVRVYNVLHGFEGDLDENHQRSRLNGWRFDGLPWQQL